MLAGLFFGLALLSGGLGALLVPPGEPPDEPAHIARADSLVHGEVIGRRGPDRIIAGRTVADAGVLANGGLFWSMPAFPPGLRPEARSVTQAEAADLRQRPWSRRPSYISSVNTGTYPPLFYIPAAIGIRVAQAEGWTPWRAIRLARLCDLLAYAATGAAALLLARRAHPLLLAALLLPMSLYLAGSVNQDGVLIAVAVLAAALLTRAGAAPAWAAALTLAPVIAAKPVYLPLAGLLLLAGAGWRARIGAAVLAGLPGMAWFLVARRLAAVPFPLPAPYPSGPLWPGPPTSFIVTDPALQAQVVLHQPLTILGLIGHAMLAEPAARLGEMVGVLGKLDLLLPDLLYPLWYVALAVALASVLVNTAAMPDWGRVPRVAYGSLWGAACIAAAVFAIYFSQYLAWSPVGADGIAGVQGRYFIPLLPFLAFALPQVPTHWGDAARAAACVPVAVAASIGAVIIPVQTVATYYWK